jgi:hypothetical protein
MRRYELLGYGDTPGKAADDAWTRYNGDRDTYIINDEEWE